MIFFKNGCERIAAIDAHAYIVSDPRRNLYMIHIAVMKSIISSYRGIILTDKDQYLPAGGSYLAGGLCKVAQLVAPEIKIIHSAAIVIRLHIRIPLRLRSFCRSAVQFCPDLSKSFVVQFIAAD